MVSAAQLMVKAEAKKLNQILAMQGVPWNGQGAFLLVPIYSAQYGS